MASLKPRRLNDPPIVEVVCGFFFRAHPAIDPVLLGKYWAEVKESKGFKPRPIEPPVTERPGLSLIEGAGPLRASLVSGDDVYVIQIQPDRLYCNWRLREKRYPHFRDDGDSEGVLTRSLAELGEFREFCKRAIDFDPEPQRIELSKIDQLVEGKHYRDLQDLGSFVPLVESLATIVESPRPMVQIAFVETRAGHDLSVQLTSAVSQSGGPAVQFETRATRLSPPSREAFELMNQISNDIFFKLLVDAPATWARFGGEKS